MSEQLARWLLESTSTIAFTGAGISTESGIPDFRSPGGIWSNAEPVDFSDFVRSEESRVEYWRQKSAAHLEYRDAEPNVGHQLLARWESQQRLAGLITQNIDGLHQLAGSREILEIHGTAREVTCLDCGWRDDVSRWVTEFLEDGVPPRCPECRGPLKHATISFGQMLAPEVLEQCSAWTRSSELFLVMGSSLVVHPAAGLPETAKQHGAKLVIINRDPTPCDHIADLVLRGPLGETLQAVDECLSAAATGGDD
jgi:NAD-dependent deacetylase